MSATEAGGPSSNDESSSSDGDGDDKDKCPICLHKFRNQAIGTPENCAHTFCFDCISEWAAVRNGISLL